ncbi:anti-sigma factor antagonist [Natronoglycomyces albus]|uniref:Anti-sigma factor antagonist n=1 Tax=Natronoglycomyces albus TaxID=2811108 RepID=A0A895XII5_9ACTN|nr:anti-sigma factor antagonist [Natronoglycomyces albus]QSB04767.1 anti-sigma factor antagonist [Natronoglycomyces albus]
MKRDVDTGAVGPELQLRRRQVGSIPVVAVSGEIDVYTAPRLREVTQQLASEGHPTIAVDMNEVEFCDSTGLGVLIGARKRLQESGGDLVVLCSNSGIMKLLRLTGLDQVLTIRDELSETELVRLMARMGNDNAFTSTDPTVVRFSFSPSAAYVRAARLVAADVAEKAGVASNALDEIRQAIGEACSRAVLRHKENAIDAQVRIEFSISDRFIAKVTDSAHDVRASKSVGGAGGELRANMPSSQQRTEIIDEAEEHPEEVTLVVLAGLVEDLVVTPSATGVGTTIAMSWPLSRSSDKSPL